MSVTLAQLPSFIDGDGEMAVLIRNHNWSSSSLGNPQYWPQSLSSTLSLLLNSAFPMFLFWGEEHTCFYNDAFRPMLGNDGKHPSALGNTGKIVWNEIWPSIEPLINIVIEGQSTGLYEDLYLPIYRNGRLDDAYWTFSYNPVKDEHGIVRGVLAIVHETTSKVKEKKEADALQLQLQLALEACDLGTFDVDISTRRFSCNQRTKQIFGLLSLESNDLNASYSTIHPDDRTYVKNVFEQAMDFASGGKHDIEYTIIDPVTNQQRIIRSKGRVFFDEYKRAQRLAGTIQDITTEKLSDRRKKKLQQLVENSNDFMAMASMDGQMIYINTAGRKIVGLEADFDITTIKNSAFYSDEQWQLLNQTVLPVLNEKKQWDGFVKIRNFKTGEEIPCHANYLLITDADTGETISRAVTFRDLRYELAARKELEDSEKRFRNLVQEAPVATAIYIGREMKIQWANDAMIKLWGKDKSVIGKTIREALPELEGQPFHQQLNDVFTTGIMYQGTEDPGHLVVNGKLQTFYFNFTYKALRDIDGNIYGILNMAIDVTESVKVKRQLEESERNFRSLIMQAPIGITLLKGDDHIVELANDQYLMLVGRERKGFLNKPIWELIPEAKEQGFDIILKNVKETGEPFFGNEIPVLLVRNGILETVYINFVYEPLFDEERKVHSILVIAIDVTKQVEARKLVEISEERARLAIESARLGTYEVNLKTLEVHASSRMYELYDIDPSIKHQDFLTHIHPDDLSERQKAHEVAMITGRLEYECRIQRKDGSINWLHAAGQYYFDENGNAEKAVGIVKDITKEKTGEQELERRVKERTEALTKLNEELQQFIYVSSHDLKEPLRKVQVFTSKLRTDIVDAKPELLQYTEKITASSQRMTTLINDLLNYSTLSNTEVPFEDIDLAVVIDNIKDDMEVLIKEKNATISAESLPCIKGIPFQVNQLFYNLLNNAIKFSKENQSPIIKIHSTVLDEEEQKRFALPLHTTYHKIEVIDNGIGFDTQYAERIFVVFQRLHLKHEYSGNGIGLAICKKIVQNHKGLIYAQSEQGYGSRFTILLPRA
jgi:PAS domain S-box-containing protein